MIITIRVTEAAIEHIKEETGLDEESAGELAQMLVGLYEVKGSPDPESIREEKLRRLLSAARFIAINKRNFIPRWYPLGSDIQESALEELEQALGALPEGEGIEDRIRETAREVVRVKDEFLKADSPLLIPTLLKAITDLEQAIQEGDRGSDKSFPI